MPAPTDPIHLTLGEIELRLACELTDLADPGDTHSRTHRPVFAAGSQRSADEPGLGRGTITSAPAQQGPWGVTREIFTPADGSAIRAVRLRVQNRSDAPAWLDELRPVVLNGAGLDLRGPADGWTYLRQPRFKNGMPAAVVLGADTPALADAVAGLSETGKAGEPLDGGYPCEFTSGEVMALLGPAGALTIGQLPLDRQAVLSRLTMSPARDALERLAIICDCNGVRVDPGCEVLGQWVVMTRTDDLCSGLNDYAERLISAMNPDGRADRAGAHSPTVWCSWYYFDEQFTQAQAEAQLDWLEKHPLPIDVFQIDDCWSARWGDWEPNLDWPDLPGLAERITRAGMAAGIWTCPTLAEPRSRLRFAHDDWLLRNRAGEPTRFFMSGTDCFVLDPTHPGVLAWTEELYRRLSSEWGFAYHKIDFTRSVVLSQPRYHDPTKTPAEAYRMLIEAIRRGIGRQGYLNICGGQYGPAVGLADAQRTGSDVRGEWPDPPPGEESCGYGPFAIKQNTLRFWMNRLWDNDPDALMVRRRSEPVGLRHLSLGLLSDDEALTSTLNQYLGGGLVCFSEDLAEVDHDRLMLLRHCTPSIGRAARPADIAAGPRYPAICVTDVTPRAAGLAAWVTVAVINWYDQPRTFEICLDASLLGDRPDLLTAEGLVLSAFRAGWDRRADVGETIRIGPVPPHGCEVVKVQPARPGRMLLGTDGHFSMGGVEVTRFDPAGSEAIVEVDWPWPIELTMRVGTVDALDSPEHITAERQRMCP